MPRKTELLNQELSNAKELANKGDTAAASTVLRLIEVDAYITILDKLTEIEKHLGILADHESKPITLEKVASKPNTLAIKGKGS